MQLFFKVHVQFPAVGGFSSIRRSLCFKTREEADAFTQKITQRNDGIELDGYTIDHLMTADEADRELDEEMELLIRATYSGMDQ